MRTIKYFGRTKNRFEYGWTKKIYWLYIGGINWKKSELNKLKKLLQQEINRINELLSNDLIQEFLSLNELDIKKFPLDDKWLILEDILKEFQITETNGILVCTGSYLVTCDICYQETNYYSKEVSFDNPYIEYQTFKDIENSKIYKAYTDKYIQSLVDEESKYYPRTKMTLNEFCHKRYGSYLTSEIKEKYIILNPYNTSKNENGFKEVRKDFFTKTIEKGQSRAKQLVLTKHPQIKYFW